MGHHQGFNRQHSRHGEEQWGQHSGRGSSRRGRGGPWGDWAGFGGPGHQGPPPWVAGLFGLSRGEQPRGPRVRRGDVRAAILDVLRTAEEQRDSLNGYQVIGTIAERSGNAWRPSPGSVYPTIQLLEDEGLVASADEGGRRALSLTDQGKEYVAAHQDELDAVWKPFERRDREDRSSAHADLKPEIGQVMGAVWQIVTQGSESQRAAAVDVLIDTRRRLYGILADGDETDAEEAAES